MDVARPQLLTSSSAVYRREQLYIGFFERLHRNGIGVASGAVVGFVIPPLPTTLEWVETQWR